MALTAQERKARQRASDTGYPKSREHDWKRRGIKDISYVQYLEIIVKQHAVLPHLIMTTGQVKLVAFCVVPAIS